MKPSNYQEHLERVEDRRERLKASLADLFKEPTRLSLEIGCGHGHWLVAYAAAHPEKTCLGIDLIGDRVGRAERKLEREGALNAAFLRGEAFEVLELLPEFVRLEEVFILFPDPWPKKRHWKNRIFNHTLLEALAKRCERGGRCFFRTDHEGYFQWAEERLAEQSAWKREEAFDWPFEVETVFQSKADSYQSLVVVKK